MLWAGLELGSEPKLETAAHPAFLQVLKQGSRN